MVRSKIINTALNIKENLLYVGCIALPTIYFCDVTYTTPIVDRE